MNSIIPSLSSNEISEAADRVAAGHAIDDYRSRKSYQTLRRQKADLDLFKHFLSLVGIKVFDLHTSPYGWGLVSWGLVEGFVKWQIQQGYALTSVNVHLSTIKVYAKLALKSGSMAVEQHALIQTVSGYSYSERVNLDAQRDVTRIGKKKSTPTVISLVAAQTLKTHHEQTAQGRRDRLLMTLLLDHGMRIGEVEELKVKNFDLEAGTVRFWRPKVKMWSTHELTKDSQRALKNYQKYGDMPVDPDAPIMRASIKSQALTFEGVTRNKLSDRVRVIGQANDIPNLSAHDCRHYWATRAAGLCKGDPFRLQEAGGWASLDMPRRYIRMAEIANEGLTDL